MAKVIHNFGRKDKVDKESLARLVSCLSRILDLPMTGSSVASSDIEIVDSRLGGAFVLDQPWERLAIASALRTSSKGRCIDVDVAERICFALVAQRFLEPASKLAGVRWAMEWVAFVDVPEFGDDAACAAMEFLLSALLENAEQIFSTTANLLHLSCDIIFVDTSSTYFERDVADGEADLDLAKTAEEKPAEQKSGPDDSGPEEQAVRRFEDDSAEGDGHDPSLTRRPSRSDCSSVADAVALKRPRPARTTTARLTTTLERMALSKTPTPLRPPVKGDFNSSLHPEDLT